MESKQLAQKLQEFKRLLQEHRELYGISLDEYLPDQPVRNHERLQEQQKELSKLFYVLDGTLTKYSRGRVMTYPATGARWDIYRAAIGNDIALVKGPPLDNAVLELEGIIAIIEEGGQEQVQMDGASAQNSVTKNIFVSHGTPSAALQKLERFIRALGLNPVIVKDQPSKGGAVDDVVPRNMEECTCAVILATKDDAVGGRFQPRPNVLHEIGLAQEKLNNRVIYLKEDGCDFPSNVTPKIWENFSQANMEEAFIKVAKELRAFGVIRTR